MQEFLESAVEGGVFPGATVGVVSADGAAEFYAVGTLAGADTRTSTDTNTPTPVTRHTVYDTASVTKSVVTALLAALLEQEKLWQWDDLLTRWLPKYTGDHSQELMLGDLQNFVVGFEGSLASHKDLPAQDLWQHILQSSIVALPTKQPVFLNTTSILLGQAVERATGKTLAVLFEERIAQPLQLQHTSFTPDATWPVAPSEIDAWRGREIRGEVHDESAWKLREIFVAGSAGLFSTAPDIAAILQDILLAYTDTSTLGLSSRTVTQFAQGMGWETHTEWLEGAPAGTFGKTGFTGCTVVVNLEQGKAGVMLSNATYPERPQDRTELTKMRQAFCSEILG